jgi:hypothetical protein
MEPYRIGFLPRYLPKNALIAVNGVLAGALSPRVAFHARALLQTNDSANAITAIAGR